MLRISIADDHDVVRTGLRAVLEANPNWQVVGEARNGKEAIRSAIETKPDIIVLEYSLPLINGIEVTRQIRAQLAKAEILIFTMHDTEVLVAEILRAGARGYVLKSDVNRHLIAAIEALASHQPYFSEKVSETLLRSLTARPQRVGSTLTERERQIVQLIAEGHTNKAIAKMLDISLKTVETHRSTVMRKLELSSSAALVRYAVRNELVHA